ncbi:hypothetical protein BT96DRAFT_759048, partial [Gymnopus androsaceus JB14]
FGEVWYYFLEDDSSNSDSEDHDTPNAFAMVSLYSQQDSVLYEDSSKTLWACGYLGSKNLCIVLVEEIKSVISMQP